MSLSNYIKRFQTFGGLITPRCDQVVPGHNRTVPNVHTSNSICIPFVSTKEATEFEPAPVAGVDMPAERASSACVLGTDQFKGDALGFGFVLDKELSLGVRPATDFAPHILALGGTCLTDVRKVLHSDASGSDGLGILHQLLGGYMHQLTGNAGLMSGHPLEQPLGGLCAFGLNLGSCPADASSLVVQCSSGEGEGFAIGGVRSRENPLDPRVHADYAAFGLDFRNVDGMAENEVPAAIPLLQLGILPSCDRRQSLVGNGHGLAPEAQSLCLGEGEVPVPDYEKDWSLEDYWMPLFSAFLGKKCSSDMLKGRAGKLGRKSELLPDCAIMLVVEFNGIGLLSIIDNLGYPVAGIEELAAEFVECVELCGVSQLESGSPDIHYSCSFSGITENPSTKWKKERFANPDTEDVRVSAHK